MRQTPSGTEEAVQPGRVFPEQARVVVDPPDKAGKPLACRPTLHQAMPAWSTGKPALIR